MPTKENKTTRAVLLMIAPITLLIGSLFAYAIVNWILAVMGGVTMLTTIFNVLLFIIGAACTIAFIPCLVIGIIMLANRNKSVDGAENITVSANTMPPELQKYIKLARATSIILAIVYILGVITIPIGIWHIVFASNLSTKKLPARGMVKATAIISIFACWSLLAIFICVFFWHFNGILKDLENDHKISRERVKASEPIAALVIACLGLAVLVAYYIAAIAMGGSEYESTTPSLSDTTAQLAASAKLQTNLPETIDSVTTLTDITSSGTNIQYHDTVAGADPSAVTEQALYAIDKPAVCGSSNLASYLQEGIGFQYIYTVAETGAQYTITITNNDCL